MSYLSMTHISQYRRPKGLSLKRLFFERNSSKQPPKSNILKFMVFCVRVFSLKR